MTNRLPLVTGKTGSPQHMADEVKGSSKDGLAVTLDSFPSAMSCV
jgi:hypothetical protein